MGIGKLEAGKAEQVRIFKASSPTVTTDAKMY
jgi:hypothetical protein